MAKKQKKFLAPDETLDEIKDLVRWFPDKNQTEIFTKAIHQLWEKTNKVRNPLRCEHCKTAFNYYAHLDAYVQQCDCSKKRGNNDQTDQNNHRIISSTTSP